MPLLSASCAGTIEVRKPYGDRVTVTLRQPSIHSGEALAASDSLVYLDVEKAVCVARVSDVERVFVHGYKIGPVSRWFWGAAYLFTGMGLTFALLADRDLGTVGVMMAFIDLALGVGAATSCTAPEPDIAFSGLSEPADLERFRLHCRYPQGLTSEQWALLLRSRGQQEFTPLPRE